MPTIRPRLKRRRADGKRPVAIEYRHRDTRAQLATGVAVRDDCLDADALKVLPRPAGSRNTPADPRARQDTDALRRVRNALSQAVSRCELDGIDPAAARVKAMAAEALTGTERHDDGPRAADYLRELVRRRSREIAASTERTYLVTAGRLDAHASGVRIGEMDMRWRDGYVRRLRSAGLAPGSVWADLKQIRTALNDAEAHGHETPGAHRVRGWMPKSPKPETYALTEDELGHLRAVDLDDRLDGVRDLFLFAAATGMRYSELRDLNTADWDDTPGAERVRFYAPKTDSYKVVPLNAEARRILNRRAGVLPRVPTNQRANDYLKEVGAAAGLDRIVPRTKTGVPVPLAESISMHDARRTFATLAWRAGVPPAVIMGLTGHTTERQLRTYINLTDDATAEDARRHKFFA